MRAAYLAIMATFPMAACVGPLAPVVTVDDQTGTRIAGDIRTYTNADLEGQKFQTLTAVEGLSCKNKIWDKSASQDAAIQQVKLWARQAGGNAITNLLCEAPQGTTLVPNCWESVKCRATAIRTGQ